MFAAPPIINFFETIVFRANKYIHTGILIETEGKYVLTSLPFCDVQDKYHNLGKKYAIVLLRKGIT